jgi:hypothetical protein
VRRRHGSERSRRRRRGRRPQRRGRHRARARDGHSGDAVTLAAHEPPIPALPDAEAAERARAGFRDVYEAKGRHAGIAAFIAMSSVNSPCHEATAELLGQQATVFPSHHGGFMGGEFGYAGQPEAFARKLREVLDAGG